MMLQCCAGPLLGYNRRLLHDFTINIWLFYDSSWSVSPGGLCWAGARRRRCLRARRGTANGGTARELLSSALKAVCMMLMPFPSLGRFPV